MIIYALRDQHIVPGPWTPLKPIADNAIWIDLHNPTREEELAVEAFLGMEIPTREELHEIEVSSRLYHADNVQFMTATLVTRSDTENPETSAVTFVVAENILVTIRYVEPKAFSIFASQICKLPPQDHSSIALFFGLLDAIVNRNADVLECIGRDIDSITQRIFRRPDQKKASDTLNYQRMLSAIGRTGDLLSKLHESLASLARLITFASHVRAFREAEDEDQLNSLGKDIAGLIDHSVYLTDKVQFLLDATLGMVSIEQNVTLKIFSVASLVLMPPTLIAGIYGMNFKNMPELNWHDGYPLSLFVMLLSAVLPYAYFKKKKWL